MEHVTRMFVMVGLVGEVPSTIVHRINEWIVEWIMEGVMAGKEGSKEVKWI